MDALRRAETNDSPTSTATESVVANDSVATPPAAPASDDLQLEPMDKAVSSENVLAGATEHDVANDTATVTTRETTTTADDKPAQVEAQRAVQAMARKHSPVKKQALFIFTGFAAAGFILAAYYLWQNERIIAPHVPHSATLVTAPETSLVEDITEEVSTIAVEPAKQIVAANINNHSDSAYPSPSPGNAVPPATAATNSMPVATNENPKYKIKIHKRRTQRAVPTQLKQAYQAYQLKDYQQAEQLYREALRRYPGNQDAMLGLAAIALHQGDRRVAHYYYSRILKTSPGDKTALLAIQSLQGEQHQLEHGSQIKHWLQSDRGSAPLHFALGNQHAANARWKEAQRAYFEAYSLQPDNADFAFNLAISLDQLGLRKEALDYYLVAKTLSTGSAAQFNSSQVDRRINQLRNQAEQDS